MCHLLMMSSLTFTFKVVTVSLCVKGVVYRTEHHKKADNVREL